MKETLRKRSLERLTSPEQLDRLLVIIRPPGWIALFCLFLLIFGILLWALFGRIPVTAEGRGIYFNPKSIQVIQSQNNEIVEQIYVAEGDRVNRGAPLIGLRRLDVATQERKERIVRAPEEGRVLAIEVIEGESLSFGSTLLWFQRRETSKEAHSIYSFFPISKGGAIKPGMKAHITFDLVEVALYGKMVGVVSRILLFSGGDREEILRSIPSPELRQYLSQNQANALVIITPSLDASTPSGYQWTSIEGPPYPMASGAVGKVEVFLEEERPIHYLIPVGERS